MPYPAVKKSGDNFVVVSNWDVVFMLNENEQARVKVYLLKDDDDSELSRCITDHVNDLELPWTSEAMALLKAKQQLEISDDQLAVKVGGDRTRVTRMVKIASKLSPKLLVLADRGVLSYSDCRRLVTLPFTEQERLAIEAREKSLTSKRIMDKAFPGSQKSGNSPASHSIEIIKGTDVKRLEIDISEKIGYPFSIAPRNAQCTAGELDYQFFDRMGLIDLIGKLRSGFVGNPEVKGRIKISFESLDEFESLTGGFFN